MNTLVYKISPANEWREAESAGVFTGSADDRRDGFIHFSAAHQLRATYEKYFARRPDLMLIAVSVEALGSALKWEVSRKGETFPHLYAPLHLSAVSWVSALGKGEGGQAIFPSDIP